MVFSIGRIVAALQHRAALSAAALTMAALVAVLVALVSGPLSSRAVQNPSISINMITTGNTYTPTADADSDGIPDPGTNHMTLGPIDNCLTTHPPGGRFYTRPHVPTLSSRTFEDLVGWSARFNYMGDQLHLVNFGPTPFDDTFTGRLVGFLNLPIDYRVTHRGVSTSVSIPPACARPSDRPHRRRLHRLPEPRGLSGHAPKGGPRRAEPDLRHDRRRHPRRPCSPGRGG